MKQILVESIKHFKDEVTKQDAIINRYYRGDERTTIVMLDNAHTKRTYYKNLISRATKVLNGI